MSIRNLDALFDPSSIAVFGASLRPGSVGATVWHNLSQGPYKGPLFAVNPKHHALAGHPVFAKATDLPQTPELALICTPAATVPALIRELAQMGTRAAIVMTAGLDSAQKQAMLEAARPHLLRILGPNCIGLLAPHKGINASFSHIDAQPGELAFVSQSGALVTAMLDWAQGRGIGFSHFVSLGEHADVDFGDMLDYLASDPKTRAILLYAESFEAPRKLMSAARAAARNKPVIVVKAGRSPQGQQAAASHTGALAGSDIVVQAAIDRAGMLRVDTLQELFLAAETLSRFRTNVSERMTVLTNGGGAGVMAADAAATAGVPLAALEEGTRQRLDAVLPANWSHGNPVDIIGDAPVQRYEQALQVLKEAPETGAILFIHAPTAIVPSADIARALVPLARHETHMPPRIMSCWLGDEAVAQARQEFQQAGIATFETPELAVRAFSMLLRYRRNQEELTQAPPALLAGQQPDTAAIRALVQQVLASGRDMLTEPEAKAVLDACRIPVVPTRRVEASPKAAASAAEVTGFPVVLKILSDDISHKSDVGGVALNLQDAEQVRDAAQTMLARVQRERPAARIQGFTVQAMVQRKHAQELIVGSTIDSVFGPVILFGQGGTAVEVMADRAVALPPLNVPLAKALISRTRIARLLAGWRDTPAVDETALHGVLLALSQLLAEIPEIAELDINPLIVNFEGAVALDARIRLSASGPAGAHHFAILPYPAELEERVQWQEKPLLLRPIRPEDEAQHMAFLQKLDPEDIRMRVFYSRRTMEHSELARLVQIDYAREMAFVALTIGPDGQEQTVGVVRAMTDPDNVEAEFGVIVRSDLKGQGLGRLLMQKLIAYLRAQGTQRLVATVLDYNERMLQLARTLGFEEPGNAEKGEGIKSLFLPLN
ncbi:MAG: bifunctional acetate--CoA ligase family protein/GNAT family N-acetyltransferase [Gammaproteobacteria bacterium]|nr:bifunctional acetate--CoA ligase family protein/GNAT family N-acetyltransferase [Gammaproteobacteria bacterium]MBU0785365.1 bifunctional acetate--CoA ligase family protein/GNAT family N-acetyltransferase [Gammaproteobacteria bacterium]MBU0815948.1 bifunctional acetate--CoA ligase family protein/GNAT family N-acetyltransferase [Gammaproteobacteria bacterium]MBU1787487.1 bifunctional acetate--CoA ligase family protein/GNAT family N-acetyltransferase [Gammaproteobacteria bacterium]